MPATAQLIDALATLGTAAPTRQIAPELARDPSGRWRGASTGEAFPEGLTREQAIGMTIAVCWAGSEDAASPLVLCALAGRERPRAWTIRIPGEPARLMEAAEALPIVQALLVVRRILWPTIPWRPRDPVAEELERHARVMSCTLHPSWPPVVLTPPVDQSQIGRDWGGRYGT